MSGAAPRSIEATTGNCRPSFSAMFSSWSATAAASGWAKIVRTAAATISADPRGTLATSCPGEVLPQVCRALPPLAVSGPGVMLSRYTGIVEGMMLQTYQRLDGESMYLRIMLSSPAESLTQAGSVTSASGNCPTGAPP